MAIESDLTDVPETALWTLHNRAYEAAREDGCIKDPKCLEIYHSIKYDYNRHFGKPDGSHGVRSMIFDRLVLDFLKEHPNANIVNLGEGLETQRFRLEAPGSIWFSIDLPDCIQMRERFIQPDENHKHIPKSALDISWFDDIPDDRPTIITAQGLFMYFTSEDLEPFFKALDERFSGSLLAFDFIDVRTSQKSMSEEGWMKTKYYKTPLMPWGINREDLEPTVSKWIGKEVKINFIPYEFPRGLMRYGVKVLESFPSFANKAPAICDLTLP